MGPFLGQALGRHAKVDSPASGSGPTITAGWHTIVRVWDGQKVRQYVDGLRTNTAVTTATGSRTIYRWGWQLTGSEGLDEACVPFFGALGAARGDGMVASWSASALGMLWLETDAGLLGGEDTAVVVRWTAKLPGNAVARGDAGSAAGARTCGSTGASHL